MSQPAGDASEPQADLPREENQDARKRKASPIAPDEVPVPKSQLSARLHDVFQVLRDMEAGPRLALVNADAGAAFRVLQAKRKDFEDLSNFQLVSDTPEHQCRAKLMARLTAELAVLGYLSALGGHVFSRLPVPSREVHTMMYEDAMLARRDSSRLVIHNGGPLQSTERQSLISATPLPFGAFLVMFLKKDAKYGSKDLQVHELCLANKALAFQRVIFVELAGKFVFGMACEEYLVSNKAYLAYLEKSTAESSPVKPVLQAYFKYLAFTCPGIELHIWADPPEPGESYLFRLANPSKERSADELRQMYSNFLTDAVPGCKPGVYEFTISVPPLPPFGKKAEEAVKSSHELSKALINALQTHFSGYFRNTVWVKMGDHDEDEHLHRMLFLRRHRSDIDDIDIHGLWELRDIASDAPTAGFLNYKLDIRKRLDYRDEATIARTTAAFLAHWRETFPFGYRRYSHSELPPAVMDRCLRVLKKLGRKSYAEETVSSKS